MLNKDSSKSMRHIMSSQMSTSEPGMITIEKNYFSIKKI